MPKEKGTKLKSPFTASELNGFKTLLLKRRADLRGTVEALGDKTIGKNPTSESGDISSMPIHMADVGSDVFEHDLNLNLVENEGVELEDIEEALEKIKKGAFGMCEGCRRPIGKDRLKAIPYTRLCIQCKQKEEGT
jgi:RNA polymerase-binding transcription factor DksA